MSPHLPQWQWPLTATLRFQQQFVLDETPLPMDLIRFSYHACSLVQGRFQEKKVLSPNITYNSGSTSK